MNEMKDTLDSWEAEANNAIKLCTNLRAIGTKLTDVNEKRILTLSKALRVALHALECGEEDHCDRYYTKAKEEIEAIMNGKADGKGEK